MYSYIKGQITEVMPTHITIENNGIGYLVKVPNPYLFESNLNQDSIIVYTYQNVREDAIELFGFSNKEEKQMFISLISVKGLGPKGALAILASSTPNDLVHAIMEGNDKYFKSFPGVGAKLSQQIILDLKGKVNLEETESVQKDERIENVILALKSLGYNSSEIKTVTKQLVLSKDDTINSLVKQALRMLNKF